MPLTVVEYVREDGSSPFRRWFDALDSQAAAKVATAIARLELGNTSNVKWLGRLGEHRINWGPGLRLYLAMDGDTVVVLFGGGSKRRQQRDIEAARAMLAEYRARRAGGRKWR